MKQNEKTLREFKKGETFNIGNDEFVVLIHIEEKTLIAMNDLPAQINCYKYSSINSLLEKVFLPTYERYFGKSNILSFIDDKKISLLSFDEWLLYNKYYKKSDEWLLYRKCAKKPGKVEWLRTKNGDQELNCITEDGEFSHPLRSPLNYFYIRPICMLKNDIIIK